MKNIELAKKICKLLEIPFGEEAYLSAAKSQYNKGLQEYGRTLDQCPKDAHDWQIMAYEEIHDSIMYAKKLKG